MSRTQKAIFFALIFLIPSNLFLKFPTNSSIIDGILVDYLIPKLFLTDLLILTLIIPWLFSKKSRIKTKFGTSTFSIPYVLFLLLTVIKIPFSQNPTAALYFWLKIVEFSLFFTWLKPKLKTLLPTLRQALTASILWQSTLAISQFILQKSIFPYWFLGESQFSATTPAIAKASFMGYLMVLPMGTTPHPNVLAGFLAISTFIILQNGKNCSFRFPLVFLAFIVILLTQSHSALFALALAALIINLPNLKNLTPLLFIDPTSLTRRQTLNQIAIKMFKSNPLTGTGLNNFTATMSNYGFVEATSRFLQPVHNIYLLLLSELGLLSLFPITYLLLKIRKFENLKIPLLMLLFIGLIDHYPVTLQQGQLLLVISIAFASAPYLNSNAKTAK